MYVVFYIVFCVSAPLLASYHRRAGGGRAIGAKKHKSSSPLAIVHFALPFPPSSDTFRKLSFSQASLRISLPDSSVGVLKSSHYRGIIDIIIMLLDEIAM